MSTNGILFDFPHFFQEMGKKKTRGKPLDPMELVEPCWAGALDLPGLRPFPGYAVKGGPTGWGRGSVVNPLHVRRDEGIPPYSVCAATHPDVGADDHIGPTHVW